MPSLLQVWRSDRAFAHGQRLLRAGDPVRAAEELRAAASLNPRNGHIRLHLALALAEQGRFREALAELASLTSERPSDPVLHLFRGRVLYDAGRFAEAADSLRTALELDAGNDLARGYLLLSEMAVGDLSAKLRQLVSMPVPGNSGFQARLILLLEERMPAVPSDIQAPTVPRAHAKSVTDGRKTSRTAKRRMNRAFRLLEKHRTADAADEALSALGLDPGNSDTRLSAAAIQVLARRYKLALDILKDCDEGDPEAAAWRACALIGLGQTSEGLQALDAVSVRSAETQYFRGLALLARGRRVEARCEFARAVELDWSLVYRRIAEALAGT